MENVPNTEEISPEKRDGLPEDDGAEHREEETQNHSVTREQRYEKDEDAAAVEEEWKGTREDYETALSNATSMQEIAEAVSGNAHMGHVGGYGGVGEFQYEHVSQLIPVLYEMTQLVAGGDEELNIKSYERAVTQLERLPGDMLRRKVDAALRSQLNIEA